MNKRKHLTLIYRLIIMLLALLLFATNSEAQIWCLRAAARAVARQSTNRAAFKATVWQPTNGAVVRAAVWQPTNGAATKLKQVNPELNKQQNWESAKYSYLMELENQFIKSFAPEKRYIPISTPLSQEDPTPESFDEYNTSSENENEWIKDRRERVLRLLNWEEDIDKELERPEYNVPVKMDYKAEHDNNTSLIIIVYEYKPIAA